MTDLIWSIRPKLRAAMVDGRTLVLVVVLGGLLTLQSSNSLDAPKGAYLVAAAAATAIAAITARGWLASTRADIARPWLLMSGAYGVLLIISLGVAEFRGTQFTSWLRDAAAYALFALSPVLALACARSASRRWIIAVLAICAALAAISFAVVWLGRRSILQLPLDRIVLPTGLLAACFIALATALALSVANRRWWWAAGAGVVLGLFFVTGTRATLMLVAVPIGAGILAGKGWRREVRVFLVEISVAIAVFVVAAVGISAANGTLSIGPGTAVQATSAPPPNASGAVPTKAPDKLAERFQDIGQSLTNPGSDVSFQERFTETSVAWQAFLTSPLVGVGPGYAFDWTGASQTAHHEYTLDTPLVYLAKFGLIGLIPLGLLVAAYLRLALALRRDPRAGTEYLVAVGFGIVLVVVGILGSPIEDKGASFALIFVLALGVHALSRGPAIDPVDHSQPL